MAINIYRRNGTVVHSLESFNVGSKLIRKLMGDDYVVLPFVSLDTIAFHIGDFVNIPLPYRSGNTIAYSYRRYEVMDNVRPTLDTNTATYRYDLKLEAEYMKWRNKICKYIPQTGGKELSFSLTASLATHLSVILTNLANLGYSHTVISVVNGAFSYSSVAYAGNIDNTVKANDAKAIQYDNVNIIDALTLIAKEYECEWWVEDNIIHFGKCQLDNTPVEFNVLDNISNVSGSDNGSTYITKLYCFGSQKNLPRSYKTVENPDLTKSAIVQKRLMLPESAEVSPENAALLSSHGYALNNDGSLTLTSQSSAEEAVEGTYVNDEVYPRTKLTVQSYTTVEQDVTEEGNDGTEFTTHYTYYRITPDSYAISSEMQLEGETMHIIFTSGTLNGMDFECQPNDHDGYYEVVGNENYGRFLPDTVLYPHVGDEFVLVNWDATKLSGTPLLKNASNELLTKAIEYLDKSKIDPTSYQCVEDTDEAQFVLRELGEQIRLSNRAYFDSARLSRITGMEINLDLVYDHPTYTVSEKADYVFQSHVENSETLTFNGQSISGSSYGGGGSVYLIKLNDQTRPTDSNAYSAKRANEEFLHRNTADTAQGKITFMQGFDSKATSSVDGLENEGTLVQKGDVTFGITSPTRENNPEINSANYNQGTAGWFLDNFGNMEVESLTVRSFLEVTELLINRLQAQEGDTIFTDNDQITGIQRVVENEGTQNESVSYILDLKEKWEGYFTAQQRGNIVKGIINTLAAEQAGVIDGDDPDYINVYETVSYSSTANPKELEYYERSGAGTEQSPYVYTLTEDTTMTSGKTYYKKTQGTDDGGNKYYTSWMQVVEDRNTEGSTLENNQIRVVLYGDNQVPAQKNFEPCINMTIGRWGCFLNPNEDGISQAEKQSREKRQRLFFISASDGRIMKLRGVNKPILEQGNYGMTFGTIPDFMWEWSEVAEKALPNRDYMFAQGVICQSIIQVMPDGSPIPKYVDCGLWVDGGAQGVTPTVGSGIYLSNEYNELTGDWEIHDVWAYGCKWRCLQHQPVVSGNVTTYYPPKWNSNYWQLVEGNTNYSIEFVSSRGLSFRRGAVDTDITAYFYFGNIDITSEINAYYFNWTRHEERNEDSQGNITYTEQDVTWNAQHQGMKSIHLSNNDMPAAWSTLNKAIFTLTVTVLDGNQTLNIQNQIIS